MKIKLLYCFLILVFLNSCYRNTAIFADKNSYATKIPQKIEFYNSLDTVAFQVSDKPTFVITNHQELQAAMKEIQKADNPSPWKGARWNRIKLFFSDTIISLNTNNKVIGTSNYASGQFYDLGNDNFITKRISKQK